MASISGQSTANIDQVDGFFTTQGGGGGTATTTPTLSVATTTLGGATVTVSNAGSLGNANYTCEVDVGGTQIVANTAVTKSTSNGTYTGVMTFGEASSLTGTRTIRVKAQTFGDFIQSAEATSTYEKGNIQSRYLRIRGVTSTGANTSSRLGIRNIRFYTVAGQSGTSYPTTNLTSATSETGIVISSGHTYSSTYANWKACDSDLSNTFFWALGTSATNNWWQLEFTTPTYNTIPIIRSIVYRTSNQDADYIKITGSDTGAFAGEETDYGIYYVPSAAAIYNLG